MFTGNVVRFHGDLYIVSKVTDRWVSDRQIVDSCTLLDFSHANCTVSVSRAYPFKKEVYIDSNCANGGCYHNEGECPYEEVEDKDRGIDKIKVVADSVGDFIDRRIKKMMFEDEKS